MHVDSCRSWVFGEAVTTTSKQWYVAYSISTQTHEDAQGEIQVLPLDLLFLHISYVR